MAQTTQSTTKIVPVAGRVHISFDDAEIVSSTKALRLERDGMDSQVFVPLDDVHPGILEASDTRRTDAGPGEAHFYTIKTLTANGADEAWYYPYAEGEYAPIRDMLTFAGDRVSVRISQV